MEIIVAINPLECRIYTVGNSDLHFKSISRKARKMNTLKYAKGYRGLRNYLCGICVKLYTWLLAYPVWTACLVPETLMEYELAFVIYPTFIAKTSDLNDRTYEEEPADIRSPNCSLK
jgi:hypothetical protein